MKAYRQGDVLLIPVEEIPKTAKALEHRVLAEGEVTGHSHRIETETAVLLEDGPRRFLDVKEKSTVKHEEHGKIELPKGKFEVRIQREYEPERTRNVED